MEEKRTVVKAWIEALRLRTLPVSIAGVLTAWALSIHFSRFRFMPAILCMIFAILCQISSNFANEYYDYRDGLDKPGRSGPRRGVTEGDLKAGDMKNAAFLSLSFAMLIGLSLLYWGGTWLIIIGVVVAVGAIAYSTGPFPLSRNGLGEIAVIFFFGIIPVNITFYLITGLWMLPVVLYSVAIGLMGANVLIVNNYRDAEEDAVGGKRTIANILGRKVTRYIYLMNGVLATALALIGGINNNRMWIACVIYLPIHLILWSFINIKTGEPASKLNPFLGMSAILMLLFSIVTFI